jgi:hypothetical protein
MGEHLSNKVSWSEIVGCISLSDKQIARSAQSYFARPRFVSNKSQTKRNLLRRLLECAFDSNISLFDVCQGIHEEVLQNSDAKAMEACLSKIEELARQGWHRSSESRLPTNLSYAELSVQIEPHQILQRRGQICLLYAYFRKIPPLSTDAIRALLSLTQLCLKEQPFQGAKIVVLDCYRDKSYEDSDFVTSEPWTAKRIEMVLRRYSTAYRIRLDGSPPARPPEAAIPITVGAQLLEEGGPNRFGGDNQLSFRLA